MLQLGYLEHLSQTEDSGAILHDLMKAYGKEIWGYAYVMTKNKDAADDIMQEVFLSAYRHMNKFRGESTVKTWLFSMTRHASINFLKSAFFRKVVLVDRVFDKKAGPSATSPFPIPIKQLKFRLP